MQSITPLALLVLFIHGYMNGMMLPAQQRCLNWSLFASVEEPHSCNCVESTVAQIHTLRPGDQLRQFLLWPCPDHAACATSFTVLDSSDWTMICNYQRPKTACCAWKLRFWHLQPFLAGHASLRHVLRPRQSWSNSQESDRICNARATSWHSTTASRSSRQSRVLQATWGCQHLRCGPRQSASMAGSRPSTHRQAKRCSPWPRSPASRPSACAITWRSASVTMMMRYRSSN